MSEKIKKSEICNRLSQPMPLQEQALNKQRETTDKATSKLKTYYGTKSHFTEKRG